MARHTQPTRPRVDSDGVRVTRRTGVRPTVWLLVLAMSLVGVAVFVVFEPAFRGASDDSSGVPAHPSGTGTTEQRPQARPAAHPPARPARVSAAANNTDAPSAAGGAPPADVPAPAAAADAPAAAGAPEASDEATGIAVFPPPGTKPLKRGIVVPDDFELPPGYVRHFQTTDDGKQAPAILMFHPDYQPVDEHGAPIPLPADRVVPPELAPPGLPLRMLDVPDAQVPMIEPPADHGEQDSTP